MRNMNSGYSTWQQLSHPKRRPPQSAEVQSTAAANERRHKGGVFFGSGQVLSLSLSLSSLGSIIPARNKLSQHPKLPRVGESEWAWPGFSGNLWRSERDHEDPSAEGVL